MPADTLANNYARCIASSMGGHPLIRAGPDSNYPNFATEGTENYDLAYLGRSGVLNYLFCTSVAGDHPRNLDDFKQSLAPSSHVPVMVRESNYHLFRDDGLSPEFTYKSESVSVTIGEISASGKGVASATVDFEMSSTRGALLYMPQRHVDFETRKPNTAKNYARDHTVEWYKFANMVRGSGIHNTDLYFITGGHKTYEWYTTTVYENSRQVKMSFALHGIASAVGLKASGKVVVKKGSPSIAHTFIGPIEGVSHPTQCTMVRGYRLRARRFRVFGQHKYMTPIAIDESPRTTGMFSWTPYRQHDSPHPESRITRVTLPLHVERSSEGLADGSEPLTLNSPPNIAPSTSSSQAEPGADEEEDVEKTSDVDEEDEYISADEGDGGDDDEPPAPGGPDCSGGTGGDFVEESSRDAGTGEPGHDTAGSDSSDQSSSEQSPGGQQDYCESAPEDKQSQQAYHPLNGVIDVQDESTPWSDGSMAHDDTWLSVVAPGEYISDTDELASRIMCKFVAEVDETGVGLLIDRESENLTSQDLTFVLNFNRHKTDIIHGFDVVRNAFIPNEYILLPPAYGRGVTLFPGQSSDNGRLLTRMVLSCRVPGWTERAYHIMRAYSARELGGSNYLEPSTTGSYMTMARNLCEEWKMCVTKNGGGTLSQSFKFDIDVFLGMYGKRSISQKPISLSDVHTVASKIKGMFDIDQFFSVAFHAAPITTT